MRPKGFSVVELLVVLAVIGVGLTIVLIRASAATRDQRRDDYVHGVQLWTDAVRNAYSELGSFTGATAIDLRRFAPTQWQAAATVVPPIGGIITPSVVTYLGLPSGGVQLVHSTLPQRDCGAVVTSLQSDFVTLSVNATTLKANSDVTFSRAQADAACNAASNTLTGVFK